MSYVESHCCVCYERGCVSSFSCNHVCMCRDCYMYVLETSAKCPLCRRKKDCLTIYEELFSSWLIEYRIYLFSFCCFCHGDNID